LGSKPSLLKITSAPSTGFIGIQSKIEDYKPLKVYIEEVKKRDIFRPVQAAGTVAKFSLQGLTKDLVLSGIYQGKYPEAIIEDKTTKKVYFLKEGDEVKGLKVKSILKDRVILQYGEEEVELL
jgi:type II secretory pathway component PulC